MVTIISLFSFPAVAGDFDGSKTLICAVMDLVECQPGGKCQQVTAEEVGLPQFLKINFKEKIISATHADGDNRHTPIENLEKIDGKLITSRGWPDLPDFMPKFLRVLAGD